MKSTEDIALKYLRAAHKAICKDDYKNALRTYKEIIDPNGEDAETLYLIAYCSGNLDDNNSAAEYCQKALSLNPYFFYALQMMAIIMKRVTI